MLVVIIPVLTDPQQLIQAPWERGLRMIRPGTRSAQEGLGQLDRIPAGPEIPVKEEIPCDQNKDSGQKKATPPGTLCVSFSLFHTVIIK